MSVHNAENPLISRLNGAKLIRSFVSQSCVLQLLAGLRDHAEVGGHCREGALERAKYLVVLAVCTSVRGEMKCTWLMSRKEGQITNRIRYTLRGTNISHLGKRKNIFKSDLEGVMLVSRRVLHDSFVFCMVLRLCFPISFIKCNPRCPWRTSLPCDKISKSIKASWIPGKAENAFCTPKLWL